MRYPSEGKRLFGIAVPISSINTKDGWRVGEYPDIVSFARLASSLGAGLVQILPVNDTGSQSSPYSALSAFALHPLYIRIDDLPEILKAPKAKAALARFAAKAQKGERFPYEDCLDAKLTALRAVYDASAEAIVSNPELKAFISERPWIKTYAVFKRLKASYKESSWRDWPEHRDPTAETIEQLWNDPSFSTEQFFHAWVQMRAFEQFSAAAGQVASMKLVLLGDIPILMNEDSADVWSKRSFFDTSMRAGAPPDMYSAAGQNWGFPLYDWNAMASDGHSFWRTRIAEAGRFYSAYRIDHVLGFFRIWALGDHEETGALGRFMPGALLSKSALLKAGFSEERLRWLSEPHVEGAELRAVQAGDSDASTESDANKALNLVFDRIGEEDLFLFKKNIRGESDITSLGLATTLSDYIKARWRDRALLLIEGESYSPVWSIRESRAWSSLSDDERKTLSVLIDEAGAKAELAWEKRGRELLTMLKEASTMMPCAEDLGAVPDCVPRVLAELKIPGLRVPRWMRLWDEPGQVFRPLEDYGVLSACTPSVHDSSTLRAWWEEEEGREEFCKAYCPTLLPAPKFLAAKDVPVVLKALAGAPSLLFVTQVQDIMDACDELRSDDPSIDRINVPGTVAPFNWTWRMPSAVEDLEELDGWIAIVGEACRRYNKI